MTTKTTQSSQSSTSLRLLVVEDEMVVAMSLKALLSTSGHDITMVGQLPKALETARTGAFDGALLDINLRGERVFPVAVELDQRDIPFIFLSGYSMDHAEPPWHDRPVLEKPYTHESLLELIEATFTA